MKTWCNRIPRFTLIFVVLGVLIASNCPTARAADSSDPPYEAQLRKVHAGGRQNYDAILRELFDAYVETNDQRILHAFRVARVDDPTAISSLFPQIDAFLATDPPATRLCDIYDFLVECDALPMSLVASIERRYATTPPETSQFVRLREASILLKNLPASESSGPYAFLEENLAHKQNTFRLLSARQLGLVGERASSKLVPTLVKLLKDPSPAVRVFAARSLWTLRERRDNLAVVLVQALDEPDEAIVLKPQGVSLEGVSHRHVAVHQLGRMRAAEAVQRLVAAIGDEDELVRLQAAKSLQRIGDPTPQVASALRIAAGNDSSHAVRTAARDALHSLAGLTDQ